MITVGSKVIWRDPYWSDLSITGTVVEDYGTNVVVADNDVNTLRGLIKSDFEMGARDKDFKLTHEQLIKATKILLYKMNLVNKKN